MPLIILFGDDYQLPPIKEESFFRSGFEFASRGQIHSHVLNIQANLKDISKVIDYILSHVCKDNNKKNNCKHATC
jgi:hypothetical protein